MQNGEKHFFLRTQPEGECQSNTSSEMKNETNNLGKCQSFNDFSTCRRICNDVLYERITNRNKHYFYSCRKTERKRYVSVGTKGPTD